MLLIGKCRFIMFTNISVVEYSKVVFIYIGEIVQNIVSYEY